MKKHIKIYSADYLMNNELTDDDLKTLVGDHQLLYSLIVEMFKISKSELSQDEIINIIRTDNKWIFKYFWTKKQRNDFEEKLKKIFRNIYYYSDPELTGHVQMWMIHYGLSIKGNNLF